MSQVETAVSKFAVAWRSGQFPKISDYLNAGENPRESLLELVMVDLEFRWRQSGDWTHEKTLEPGSNAAEQLPAQPGLEDYLLCYPDLGPIDELPVEAIVHEYDVRNKYGDRPAMESYQHRFPQQYPAFCKTTESFRDELTAVQREQAERDTVSNAAAQGVGGVTLPPRDSSESEARSSAPLQTASQVGRLPEKFGRYKILKVLGEGGMGAVYLAEDPDLDRKVAIKVPFFEHGDSKAVLDRFRREAKSIAALHHPNICPIFEVSETDGTHYMAMAFIEGKPLSSYVRPEKGQDIRAAVKMVHKIAVALHDAHQRGVIHRDLKPDNIMIDRRKEPVIMDFGLARREGKADTQLTTAGQIMGTPSYMPPEQVAGRVEDMGPGCDIYSLGVILYELLTGRLPFTGGLLAILTQIAVDRPQPPSTHRAEIDAELDAICQKAMEKKISDRYASMAEFAKALNDYANGTARRTGKLDPVPPADDNRELLEALEHVPPIAGLKTATMKPHPSPTRSPKTARDGNKRKGPPMVAIACGGAALLLLASIVFFMQTKDGTIRVEINDPAIEVAIKGTDIILKQADQGKDVTLSPGERTLVVQREGFKFETSKLTLKKGDEITVQVELLGGEVFVRQGENVIGQQRLPRSGLAGDNPNSGRNVDLKRAIVGGYQPESPTNDWNYVDIQMDGEGNLIWKNAAGVSWSIVLKGTDFWTGPDCLYGEKKLAIERNDAGLVSSVAVPPDGAFPRNPNASAVVRERTSSAGKGQPSSASNMAGTSVGQTKVFGTGAAPPAIAPFNADQAKPHQAPARTTTPDRAVSFVESLGGKVIRDDNSAGKPVTGIELTDTNVTDAGLKELASLTNLSSLNLSQTQVTDAGLKELAHFKNLRILHLWRTQVTDAGLTNLAPLTNLYVLDLNSTQVTDAGLKNLAPLTNLGVLSLPETKVTNAGLKELASHTNLSVLDLRGTLVTDAGVKELQKALPKCKIVK